MSLSLVALDYHSDDNDNDNDIVDDNNEQGQVHVQVNNINNQTSQVEQNKEVWSICLDPNTGCPYYWEQNSNRVSWEPPPGYSDSVSSAPNKASVVNSVVSQRKISNHNHSQTPLFPIDRVPSKRVLSDDDDDEEEPEEKIELITSYYNCDSASDDESKSKTIEPPPKSILKVKSKSVVLPKNRSMEKDPVLYGPQLPEEIEKAIFLKSEERDTDINQSTINSPAANSEHAQSSNKYNESKIIVDDVISKIENEKPIDVPDNENSSADNGDKIDQPKSPLQLSESVVNKDEIERKRKLVFANYSSKCPKRENQNLSESKTYDITYTTKYSESFEISGERVGLGFSKPHDDNETEKKSGAIIFEKGETIIPKNDLICKNQLLEDQEILNAKLKYLTSIISPVPVVHRLFIEMKVLWAAYEAGELSTKYMKDQMSDMVQCLIQQEEQAVSPPWIYRYHSDMECYMYENTETGECQKEHPSEQDMDICCTPPLMPSSPYSPPPPPSLSPDNRLQSEEYSSCSKDLNSEATSKPNEENLVAALDSFYSDIAALDTNVDVKSEKPNREVVPTEKNIEASTNTPQVKEHKKKFKSKVITTGLKNKSMSTLVEKWKKVQESL